MEVIQDLLGARGLARKDLWPVFGRQRVSDILNRRRSISKAQAKNLGEFFHLPVELFL